jgi:hypothetical protein
LDSEGSGRIDAMVAELLTQADRMSATFFRLTSKQLAKADLSSNRFSALRALLDGERLTMSGLAARLSSSSGAVAARRTAARCSLRSRLGGVRPCRAFWTCGPT